MTDTRTLSSSGTHVWLRNDETGGTWECPLDYEDVALSRGWSHTEAYDDSLDGLFDNAPGSVQEGGAVQTGFDPTEHTASEVKDYLSTLDPDGGEYARVVELERSGKHRTTITGD